MNDLGADPECRSVFEINQACQRAIGATAGASDPKAAMIALEFAPVPPPASWGDALLAAQLLRAYLFEFGRILHASTRYCRNPSACGFDPQVAVRLLRAEALPARWRPADTVREWAAAYECAFAAAHPLARVAQARARLKECPERRSVAQLAREAAVSPSDVRSGFSSVGLPPRDYQIVVRAVRAFELLRNTTWKIEIVASISGWKSKKNLYGALKHVFDLRPAQVRALPADTAGILLAEAKRRLELPPCAAIKSATVGARREDLFRRP